MYLSELSPTNAFENTVDAFGGYNHNLRIGDNEFYDMVGMNLDNYPVISTRKNIGRYNTNDKTVQGMIYKEGLWYVSEGALYHDGELIETLKPSSFVKWGQKRTMVAMGSYIIIFPDKIYINTASPTTDSGSLESRHTTSGEVTLTMCDIENTSYDDAIVSDVEPAEKGNGTLWIDTSSSVHVLKRYSTSSSMWVPVATTYIRISATKLGESFELYDAVTITGLDGNAQVNELNGKSLIVMDKGVNYITVTGFIDAVHRQYSPITVETKVPDMDFVVESNNRLWGCKKGKTSNDKIVNEIYASRLGNFKNWNCFMGASTDSYSVSVGTDGDFTGAISYMGYPIFFKENCMHKIYGNYPAAYQVQTTSCKGVQKGADKTLAIVGDQLLYKSKDGVVIYDGSMPVEVSKALGRDKYNGNVASSLGQKYYIAMTEAVTAKESVWSFDLDAGVWAKEFDKDVDLMCSTDDNIAFADDDGKIYVVNGEKHNNVETTGVRWMLESGRLGLEMDRKKYISRMMVRMSLDRGAEADFYIQYDSQGEWKHIKSLKSTDVRAFSFPIRPRRCDHFKIKIEGIGDARIYSITKVVEEGSDR